MTRRRDLLHPAALAAVVLAVGGFVRSVEGAEAAKPNVLWLTCEDIGPELGCYGIEPLIEKTVADLKP